MRRVAQEVMKAMGEQGRAARDIMKSSQTTTKLAAQVRKASTEQANVGGADHAGRAVDAAGAATTVRALGEQGGAWSRLRNPPTR